MVMHVAVKCIDERFIGACARGPKGLFLRVVSMWQPMSKPPPRSLPKVLSIFSMQASGYLNLAYM